MGKIQKLNASDLNAIARSCTSVSAMLRHLGYRAFSGDSLKALKLHATKLGVDLPNGKNNGAAIARLHRWQKETAPSFADVCCINSPFSARTVRRVYAKKFPPKCTECGNLGIWCDKPLTTELDHRNGDRANNSPENLRWLCPNCHSQTPTYGARNFTGTEMK